MSALQLLARERTHTCVCVYMYVRKRLKARRVEPFESPRGFNATYASASLSLSLSGKLIELYYLRTRARGIYVMLYHMKYFE